MIRMGNYVDIARNYADSFKNAAWYFLNNQARDICNLPEQERPEEILVTVPGKDKPMTLLEYYADRFRRETINWIKKESLASIDDSVEYTPEELDLSLFSRLRSLVGADVKLYLDGPVCPPWPGAEKLPPLVVEQAVAGVPQPLDAGMADIQPDAEPDVAPAKKQATPAVRAPRPKKPKQDPKWRPIE
ncbi:MAG: hypothetical protein ABIB65_02825 [Candidatus Margulisiibacteriota bacterium]